MLVYTGTGRYIIMEHELVYIASSQNKLHVYFKSYDILVVFCVVDDCQWLISMRHNTCCLQNRIFAT